MAESSTVVISVNDDTKTNGPQQPKKPLKRKRQSSTSKPLLCDLTPDQKALQIQALNEEIEALFRYYAEMMNRKVGFGLGLDLTGNEASAFTGMVGLLMEESDLSLSKLVEQIYAKLSSGRVKESPNLTLAVVKSTVLLVGQRLMYGVPNVEADVLEDATPTCLWCWETRDLKLMPKSVRSALKIRRTCRRKIHERISAVSAMIAALEKSDCDLNDKSDLIKASEKLGKVLTEADIRLLVDSMLQKNDVELADKEAKQEEKLLIRQLEKKKREAEKEKKRMDLELQKEKRQTEKEQKRLQEEAEKDARRREKEESEIRKQARKQQEEAEKEQRRREKEEAELKKRLAIQKQASVMERFLKRSKTTSPCPNDQIITKESISGSSSKESRMMPEAVTLLIDCALSSISDVKIDDIRKLHLSSWRHIGHTIRSNRKQHWSIRRNPRTELIKKLKLTATREIGQDCESTMDKTVSGWGEQNSDDGLLLTNCGDSSPNIKKCNRGKQLLQFDKSHRPAFYGIWPKKNHVVGPRSPFKKEPDLDYDIDSDEEWEEEDPGESLSDCDKDEEEETIEEECLKADDGEESEDGFFVPDGYLSENEGVQVERMENGMLVEVVQSESSCKQDVESEEFYALLQQQKYLNNLTETALQKNQPLIILNLMHEKIPLLASEDLKGTSKLEKMCLQSLSMRAFAGEPPIEILMDNIETEDEDVCLSSGKSITTPSSTGTMIQEADMPIVVSAIQSSPQSINRVVETLQEKFPTVPKSQLRNKVREISDFVDSRWQVKKEILEGVGMPISPKKGGGLMQNISSFFSKRCLPPASKGVNPDEASQQPCRGGVAVVDGQQVCDTQ